MKNLLFITVQDPFPCKDGGNIENFFPAKYLAKVYNVSLSYFVEDVQEDTCAKYIQFNIIPYPHVIQKKDNFLTYPLALISDLPFKMYKYYKKNILKSLENIVEKNNIEIVWASSPHSAKYALELKKKYPKLKIYLREHNIEYDLVKQYCMSTSNIFMKIISYVEYIKTMLYERSLWKKFNNVFYISDNDLNKAQKYEKRFDNSNLIYSGMELIDIEENIEIEKNSFIFTGSLKSFQNECNLRYFIKNIWIPFVSNVPDAKLYITGNTKEFLLFKLKMTEEVLIQNNIINLGFVEDIKETILSKQFVISPTLYGSGIRLKVLEALSLKKVVFVSDVDYKMANCFKDMENVVHYSDYNGFYEKYLKINSKEIYDNIAFNGYELIDKYFNWNKYIDKAIKVLEKG